ncbi:MAG: hypothetical protein KAH84_01205 [Thiomargarita sp.]|nr:hypothetical protein [Thiomargarita sp.]
MVDKPAELADINSNEQLHKALDLFIQTENMETALQILEQQPILLEDEADLLLSSIIHKAQKQGHESTAQALDERRNFIRNIRQEKQPFSDNE